MTELSKVSEFFAAYERANAEFSIDKLAAAYDDVFMFGSPQGVQSVKKDDFVRLLPKRKEFFRNAGLAAPKPDSLESSVLDSSTYWPKLCGRCALSAAGRAGGEPQRATYILRANGDSFQIVFQLDHQDLTKRVADRSCGVRW